MSQLRDALDLKDYLGKKVTVEVYDNTVSSKKSIMYHGKLCQIHGLDTIVIKDKTGENFTLSFVAQGKAIRAMWSNDTPIYENNLVNLSFLETPKHHINKIRYQTFGTLELYL